VQTFSAGADQFHGKMPAMIDDPDFRDFKPDQQWRTEYGRIRKLGGGDYWEGCRLEAKEAHLKGNAGMPVMFEIMEYKAMAGRYIRASWPSGWQNIGGNSSGAPAFATEAKAQAWIDNNSAEWLRQFQQC